MASSKWFPNVKTIDELKKEYHRLARLHHPDVGGNTADMQEINSEYDRLIKILPKRAASGETYQPREDQRETREQSDAFKAAVYAAIILDGVDLEICGSWLWATGETRKHAAALKAAGYKWSAKKVAWYWHDGDYVKKSAKKYSMDEVRAMWGSEKLHKEERADEEEKTESKRLKTA